MKKRSPKLTEDEWKRVFLARCKSQRGETVSADERVLLDRAWEEDDKRYAAMTPDVFDATVPFGSSARARR